MYLDLEAIIFLRLDCVYLALASSDGFACFSTESARSIAVSFFLLPSPFFFLIEGYQQDRCSSAQDYLQPPSPSLLEDDVIKDIIVFNRLL